jgi:hypothetical protein
VARTIRIEGDRRLSNVGTASLDLDRTAWSELQDIVRSFRLALKRGVQPRVEAFLPEEGQNRRAVILELIHEEMEFLVNIGEPTNLGSYLKRFS